MKSMQWLFIVLILVGLLVSPVQAQDPIVFPAKGQSNDQMEREKFECYNWAKGQTGFDPMRTPTATTPPPTQERRSTTGGVLRGGAVGAAGGAAIGAIAGGGSGARRGVAIGGLSGGAIGGMRTSRHNRQAQQQQEQWQQQQANQYMQQRNTYNRAYTACLEGKGYTVR